MSPRQVSYTCPDYFNTNPPGQLCRQCELRNLCDRSGFRPTGEIDEIAAEAIRQYGAVLTGVEVLEEGENA